MRDSSFSQAISTIQEYLGPTLAVNEESDDEILKITVSQLFGEVWSRPGLEWRDRCLITVTTMIVQGHMTELSHHLEGAKRLGFTLEQLEEVCLQLGYYVGFPTAYAAVKTARSVYAVMGT